MKKICSLLLAMLPMTAFAYPIDVQKELNGLKIDYTTYAAKRVAKLVVDQAEDSRKLRLGCRPLAAPKSYCPYIYAADVVQ